jgi:hypothetical protein
MDKFIRLILALLVVLPVFTRADVCGNTAERVYALPLTTATPVGAGIAGRKLISVCSSNSNAATVIVQCRGDGTDVVYGDSNIGIQIAPGQCAQFGAPEGITISCASNTAGAVVKTKECTGTSPPQYLINGPTPSMTVAGTVTANQGTAGATAWPVTFTPGTVATASTPGTCTSVTVSAVLIAANATRKSVVIQAATANTKNVRWAKAATATAAQMLLEPGQTYIFDGDGGSVYTGAYAFISEDGTAQSVCVQEE